VFSAYAETASTYGAEAWNKFRPTKPSADSGQWLAELKQLPQNPWPWKNTDPWSLKSRILQFKNLGSQYLNYEFGWRPFVNDLLKIFKTAKNIENKIAYLRKNNNKWVKRRGTIKNETSTVRETKSGNISIPVLTTYFYANSSWNTYERLLTVNDRIWFEASWKFYIHDLSVDKADSVWSSRLLRHLYGLTLTPALAWELIPFSWLQDWFLNVQDVLENFGNSLYDNLVAKYAYVMRHRRTIEQIIQKLDLQEQDSYCSGTKLMRSATHSAGSVIVSAVGIAECKERARASQWGFGGGGILEDGLTDRQLRILLALGISNLS